VHTAARGAVWGLAGQILQVALYFGGYLVVARHLDAEQLGLATMVLVVTGLLSVGADFGMGLLMVQRREVDDRRAVRLALFAGLALWMFVGLGAPVLARAFRNPAGLVPLLQAGSVVLLLAGVAGPARARLQRALAFRTLVTVDVLVEALRTGGRIGFAVAGYGAWSIVLGDVLALAVGTAAAWAYAPPLQSGAGERLVADGARVVGARAADYGLVAADRFVIGRALGAGAMGLYSFAYLHTMVALQRITAVAEQVALPFLSRAQNDPQRLGHGYLVLTRAFCLVVTPFGALVWALAPWLVDALYPERWQDAVPVMRVLGVAVAAAGLNSHPGLVWIVRGHLRLRLFWSLANLLAVTAALAVGMHWGAVGVAWALASRSVAATIAAQVLTRRIAGIPHRRYASALGPGVAVAAAIAGIAALLE